MRTQLRFTAHDSMAQQNALPEYFHPDLPCKSMHLVLADIPPRQQVTLRGERLFNLYGTLVSPSHHTVPFKVPQLLRMTEPVDQRSGVPVAELLRRALLSGQPFLPTTRVRRTAREHTRFSVPIRDVELRRVQSLSAAEIRACGLHGPDDSCTFHDTDTVFATPQLALADHWHHLCPALPWTENPYVWLLELDPPVEHREEAAQLREVERLLAELEPERRRLGALEAECRTQRQRTAQLEAQITRLLQVSTENDTCTVAGYALHLPSGEIHKLA